MSCDSLTNMESYFLLVPITFPSFDFFWRNSNSCGGNGRKVVCCEKAKRKWFFIEGFRCISLSNPLKIRPSEMLCFSYDDSIQGNVSAIYFYNLVSLFFVFNVLVLFSFKRNFLWGVLFDWWWKELVEWGKLRVQVGITSTTETIIHRRGIGKWYFS